MPKGRKNGLGKERYLKQDKIKKVIEAIGELDAVQKAYLKKYLRINVNQFEMDKRIVAYLQATQKRSLHLKLWGN